MPNARFERPVAVPYDEVVRLLVDQMERPRKYNPAILYSTVLERGDAYVLRESYQPGPVGLLARERIRRRPVPGGEEFVCERMHGSSSTGAFRTVVTRDPDHAGRVLLECAMDWEPAPGATDRLSTGEAEGIVTREVQHLAAMAARAVEVPAAVRAFYDAVDRMDSDALRPLLTGDCTFRFGNRPPVTGRDRVVETNRSVTAGFASLRHDYVDVVQAGDTAFVEAWVDYTLHDGATYLLPFLTRFTLAAGLISGITIFGDISPLHDGWPGEP